MAIVYLFIYLFDSSRERPTLGNIAWGLGAWNMPKCSGLGFHCNRSGPDAHLFFVRYHGGPLVGDTGMDSTPQNDPISREA